MQPSKEALHADVDAIETELALNKQNVHGRRQPDSHLPEASVVDVDIVPDDPLPSPPPPPAPQLDQVIAEHALVDGRRRIGSIVRPSCTKWCFRAGVVVAVLCVVVFAPLSTMTDLSGPSTGWDVYRGVVNITRAYTIVTPHPPRDAHPWFCRTRCSPMTAHDPPHLTIDGSPANRSDAYIYTTTDAGSASCCFETVEIPRCVSYLVMRWDPQRIPSRTPLQRAFSHWNGQPTVWNNRVPQLTWTSGPLGFIDVAVQWSSTAFTRMCDAEPIEIEREVDIWFDTSDGRSVRLDDPYSDLRQAFLVAACVPAVFLLFLFMCWLTDDDS